MVRTSVAGAVAETLSCGEAKLHVAPVGRPVQLNATVPEKALVGATLMVSSADDPTVVAVTGAEVLRLNVGVAAASGSKRCVRCSKTASPCRKFRSISTSA